jgi:ribosome biogenesis GTPase
VGAETLLCGIAKTFRAPEQSSALAVGDIVTVAQTISADAAGADKDRSDGMILSRQPRRTALSRPQPMSSKRRNPYADDVFEKVLVANMDQVVIVAATCQPKMRVGLIDRFLIIAERGQMKTLLAVNKIDISEPPEEAMEHVRSLGVEIFPVSATRGDGLDELRAALAGRRSVLAGASGVGKSTLVNALVPGANAATREVRAKDERGRHRTTSADVYELPGGGALVDTPGLRELSIRLDAAELTWYFPEFQALAGKCRFSDCTHTHEPDCAVQAAVETGEILPRRYESYLRILETLE